MQLEDKQMDVMMRLNNLSLAVEALRNKTEQNRQMAKDAKAQADNATDLASSLEQVCGPQVVFVVFVPKYIKGSKHCGQYQDIFFQ